MDLKRPAWCASDRAEAALGEESPGCMVGGWGVWWGGWGALCGEPFSMEKPFTATEERRPFERERATEIQTGGAFRRSECVRDVSDQLVTDAFR